MLVDKAAVPVQKLYKGMPDFRRARRTYRTRMGSWVMSAVSLPSL